MEILKKLIGPVLWFLAAVFLVWGWQLLGNAYLIAFLLGLFMKIVAEGDDWGAISTESLAVFCLSAGMSAVALSVGIIWAILVLGAFVLVSCFYPAEQKGFVSQIVGSIILLVVSWFTAIIFTPHYLEDKDKYDQWCSEIKEAPIPQEIKEQVLNNPFVVLAENNSINQKVVRMDSLSRILDDKTAAEVAALREIRARDVNEELAKFDGKTEILKIRRIWLTGDVLPWTYSMWKEISYKMSINGRISKSGMFSHSGSFSGSGTIEPDIRGEAVYTGNNELSYINILFSDNSYKRFTIKDNPEWLLAREGERVRVEYQVEYVSQGAISLMNLVNPCGSCSKQYVPLFK